MRQFRGFFLMVFCAALAACDGSTVQDTLGIDRSAPDEFRVISRPPLSVPPEFTLRPPAEPGTAPMGEASDPAYVQAQDLVLTDGGDSDAVVLRGGNAETAVQSVSASELPTTADSKFLQNANAGNADPSIRSILRDETVVVEFEEEKSWLEDFRVFKEEEPVVKAAEEAERIEQNKEEGKPVTEGETPTATPKDKGPLGRLLGL